MGLAPALIGLGGSALQFLGQRGAQQQQMALSQAALNLQRQQAMQSNRLAMADRVDEFGNRTGFDGNSFRVKLSPMQQALADARQSEDYRSITQDAPRARAAAERQDARSQQGDQQFNELLREFSGRRVQTEGEGVADETFAALADRERMGSSPALATTAVRTMQTGAPLSRALQSLRSDRPSIERTLLDAKTKGASTARRNRAEGGGVILNEMNAMRGIADGTPAAPQLPQQVSGGDPNSALQLALQTLSQGAAGQAGTLNSMAGNVKAPDFSGMTSALAQAVQAMQAQQGQQQQPSSLAPTTSPRPPFRPW